jgi:hypothetical protein
MNRNLKQILLNTGIGLGTFALSVLPNFLQGQDINKDYKNFKRHKDGGQSWDGKSRHWHVTPKKDTIVSFLNAKQAMEFREKQKQQMGFKGVTDLVYDITDPSFGLVPPRSGNDTIPLTNDISIKNMGNKTVKMENNNLENTVDQIDPTTSGWVCDQYATQMAHIDYFGVYDYANCTLNSGATLPFDFTTNGTWENPSYFVFTTTTDGTPHAICGNFIGTENFSEFDVTDFDQWYFWEPQTDARVYPGDYSMNATGPIQIKWYGYYWNDFQQIWKYGNRDILKYDLNNGNPTLTYQHPDLTTYWDPLLQIQNPEDKILEFPADTTIATNGIPDSLYNGTTYSYSDNSNQTNNGTCSDVNYEVTRTWEYTAGDYNSSNTPEGSHTQNIHVEDTSPPEVETMPSDTTITKYDSMHPDDLGWPTWTDNSTLPLADSSYYDVLLSGEDPIEHWARYFTGIDVCGNEKESEAQYINVDLLESLEEKIKSDNAYSISPNPNDGNFYLHCGKQGGIKVGLYNTAGQLLEEKLYNSTSTNTKISYDLQGRSNGIYIMTIQDEKGSVETEKIIKQ